MRWVQEGVDSKNEAQNSGEVSKGVLLLIQIKRNGACEPLQMQDRNGACSPLSLRRSWSSRADLRLDSAGVSRDLNGLGGSLRALGPQHPKTLQWGPATAPAEISAVPLGTS